MHVGWASDMKATKGITRWLSSSSCIVTQPNTLVEVES